MRKYTRKKTKKRLRKLFKTLIVKGFIYSLKEAQRHWIEKREFEEYVQPWVKKQIKPNEEGNDRFNFTLNNEGKKLLNTTIKELILFEEKEKIDFVKLLFCNI